MLSLEEYIAKRKIEDNLNEFDFKNKVNNIRSAVNYIFEYFENYIDISEIQRRTIKNHERLERYRKLILDYDEQVQEWLIGLYDDHSVHMHKQIRKLLKSNDIFLLYHTDAEFRSASYECYSKLIKKHPYLNSHTEMLYAFIKDHHRVLSNEWSLHETFPFFSQDISDWVNRTLEKYGVSIPAYAYDYIHNFYENPDRWPQAHKKKSKEQYLDYDYKHHKNLFNIDTIYTKVSKKPFIKGRKQHLEVIMMYYWLHSIQTDEKYWAEYIEKVASILK